MLAGWHLWRDAGPRPGAEQMALDAAMADWARERGTTGLRLYTWAPACVSIGRHESTDRRLDRSALTDLGVQAVRRPTGGRAVWTSTT